MGNYRPSLALMVLWDSTGKIEHWNAEMEYATVAPYIPYFVNNQPGMSATEARN